MRKFMIVSLLALCLVTPNLVKAQTVTQEQVNAQLLVLIQDLMAQVQVLMTKLIAVQNQQVTDSQTLQTVVQQTQPVNYGGSIIPQPIPQKTKRELCNESNPIKIDWNYITSNRGNSKTEGYEFAENSDSNYTKSLCSINSSSSNPDWKEGCLRFVSDNIARLSCFAQ